MPTLLRQQLPPLMAPTPPSWGGFDQDHLLEWDPELTSLGLSPSGNETTLFTAPAHRPDVSGGIGASIDRCFRTKGLRRRQQQNEDAHYLSRVTLDVRPLASPSGTCYLSSFAIGKDGFQCRAPTAKATLRNPNTHIAIQTLPLSPELNRVGTIKTRTAPAKANPTMHVTNGQVFLIITSLEAADDSLTRGPTESVVIPASR